MKRLIIAALALGLLAPASAQATEWKSCRADEMLYVPVVKRLRVFMPGFGKALACFNANNTAYNVVAHWKRYEQHWRDGRPQLPRHPEGSGFVCSYRRAGYARERARCQFRRTVVRMRLHFPV